MDSHKQIFDPDFMENIKFIREKNPLIHQITNYVAMDFTANATLAIGASPLMAHEPKELDDIITIADALVLNGGTLTENWKVSMFQAAQQAKLKGIPIVLDPVGCGASRYRTDFFQSLLPNVAIVRGNASEIQALAGVEDGITKGVDTTLAVTKVEKIADELARKWELVVVVSGLEDYVTNGSHSSFISGGHPLMTKVTAMGCTASALVACFCAVNENWFSASRHAMTALALCGHAAAAESNGPGSLRTKLLDQLFLLGD